MPARTPARRPVRKAARPARKPSRPARTAAAKKAGRPARVAANPSVTLLLGTRKGLFVLKGDGARRAWQLADPQFFGQVVDHAVSDARDPRTLLAGVRSGHLGPTVFRSTDGGRTWHEAKKPPAFATQASPGTPPAPPAAGAPPARTVKSVFWLTPGHVSRPEEWWAGTSPHGIFRSRDGGATWEEVAGFTSAWNEWSKTPGHVEGTPGGPLTHSILVDPRDPTRMMVSLSTAGTFESRDEGATWTPLNKGVEATFLPEGDHDFGHDPHCVVQHPLAPDRLWQQNHCGIYRLERPSTRWERVGRAMPKAVGDIGFPIVLHPRELSTAWVVPMDGTEVWPRTSVDGRPAVYRTRNLGRSWQRQDAGFPKKAAWWTVYRQGFCADRRQPVGLYLGTSGGAAWASRDEGARWSRIASDLPPITSVAVADGV